MNKLPEYLINDKNVTVKRMGDISCIIYKTKRVNQVNEEFLLTDHLLAFVLNGEKNIYTDELNYSIHSGDAIFVQKGFYILSETQLTKGYFRSVMFFISNSLINDFIVNQKITIEKNKGYNPIFKITVIKEVQLYLETITQYIMNNKHNEDLFKLKLYELFYLLMNSEDNQRFINFLALINNRIRKDLISFMENNYIKPLSIKEYALLSGRSLSTFKREFRELYKITPAEWIKKRRLVKAKELLVNSPLSVTQICYTVGYQNISHFIRLFKEEYGLSPKQYTRNRICNNL